MALIVPEFPNPYSTTPLEGAVAWISFLALDVSSPSPNGRVVLTVNADSDSANAYLPPVAQHAYHLGQVLVPESPEATAVIFPTFAELMADPGFASAFQTIRTKLYLAVMADPQFAGAIEG